MSALNNGGVMEKEKILEGWKEIANFLNYSPRHMRRLFYLYGHKIHLRHWLGPGRRILMTTEEVEIFKKIIAANDTQNHFPLRQKR